MRAVALDLSLAATGVAWTHDHHGRPGLGCRTVHTARTRHGQTDMDHERINKVLVDIAAACRARPDLVVIEWLPGFAGKLETTIRLAELHGVIRHWLYAQRIPYADVKPTYVQMWATGTGRATKDAVRAGVTATYGHLVHVADDNQADALSMLTLALAAYGQPLVPITDANRNRAKAAVKWPTLPARPDLVAALAGGRP